MEFHFKTYKKAKENCNSKAGHSFYLIKAEIIKKQIREEYPKIQSGIWRCIYCEGITEST